MARRSKKSADELPVRLTQHVERLGLGSSESYLAWCELHGFPRSLVKSVHELKFERATYIARRSDAILAQRKRHAGALGTCLAVLDGALQLSDVGNGDIRRACAALRGAPLSVAERERLERLLTCVDRRGRFLTSSDRTLGVEVAYTVALTHLARLPKGRWRREPEDWRPRSKNRHKQFASLLRHLTAEYPVPGFLDEAWLRNDVGAQGLRRWYLHIGAGKNPRTGPSPVPLTKREAHHLLTAPDSLSVEAAVRWAQVHALGGDALLANALVPTSLCQGFENEDFWSSVLRLFVESPMLDTAQIGPLIDYIRHQKFGGLELVRPDGTILCEPAAQPGMSMHGRTAGALLGQMERWHNKLGRARVDDRLFWEESAIGGLTLHMGTKKPVTWNLRELRSSKALVLEGRAMGHCVATYTRSCLAGRCSIWSLERSTQEGSEKRLTVELNRHRVIVQARGRRNARPQPQDMDILRRWATEQVLTLGTYL